ncbi:YHYH protein [uncultured Flavobacterium sp.]|uniref:YHYH protein n=1 Tax=uncultured Flavobacterium sp. TaxID=165435 RepID=UPI0030ED2159|tara:strand:+ start:1466 stop:2440 length:975 start_codon:yes stop_codon:yes gene_type:complete
MNKLSFFLFSTVLLTLVNACTKDSEDTTTSSEAVVINVKSSNFLSAGLSEPITIVSKTLSNGKTVDCYKIVVTSLATDHEMGPWCPGNISDDASKGGIWLEGGEVYDVDGAFVKNMSTFYKDSQWMMYNATTGAITKTSTKEECANAAIPDVGVAYKNYCVQCLPSYLGTISNTYYLPVTPIAASSAISFGGPGPNSSGPSSRGIAFNGVVFDAPAPTSNILAAYTLAPFDDAGGHINLNAGYHYHAAMGKTTQIAQADGHAAMIGYAFDGYGMYQHLDPSTGKTYTDLDTSLGHYDSTRGYHYHVDYAGKNNFINSLHGEYVK